MHEKAYEGESLGGKKLATETDSKKKSEPIVLDSARGISEMWEQKGT